MNKSEAIKATRNGAIAACISAAMTLLVVLLAISIDFGGKLALWNDPLNILDVFLILACAYGMYRKSRVASIVIFVYFIAAKVIIAIETQAYSGIGLAAVFLYFYGRAIQGSFTFHKLAKEENPDYRAASKWSYIIGVPSVLITISLIAFSLMSVTGVVPSTRVQAGSEIYAGDISTLVDQGIIYAEDDVEYFYSQGLSSILESGNILTQDRVILYFTDENEELQIYEIYLDEITAVESESQGDAFNDSIYKVSTDDPDRWLKLFLSVEQKGDQKFVEALRSMISADGLASDRSD